MFTAHRRRSRWPHRPCALAGPCCQRQWCEWRPRGWHRWGRDCAGRSTPCPHGRSTPCPVNCAPPCDHGPAPHVHRATPHVHTHGSPRGRGRGRWPGYGWASVDGWATQGHPTPFAGPSHGCPWALGGWGRPATGAWGGGRTTTDRTSDVRVHKGVMGLCVWLGGGGALMDWCGGRWCRVAP
jgi:hypothetical protein